MELSQLYDHNMDNKMPKHEMYLPLDVMTNILNRLPSAFISRFQTVSKYWCYIIRSDVLSAHSKSSLMGVQLSTNVASGKVTHFNFDNEGRTKKGIHRINLGCTKHYNFSNMVNGLTCVYGNKGTINLYLINLTTFETSKHSKRMVEYAFTNYHDKIALGFDPSTGLYKLVRLYYTSYSYHCEILEVGFLFKGNWKMIGKVPHMADLDNPVFLNGAIHWKITHEPPNDGKSLAFDILKLDIKEEKFELVAPILQNVIEDCGYPNCNWLRHFTLTEENGKLYVLHYCRTRKYLDGWRLNESKRGRVWNAVFHVNLASMLCKEPRCLIGKEHASVVGIVDGKVLIRSRMRDKGVYIYDLLHKELSKHWDIECGSILWEHEFRRMLFYRTE